MVNLEPRAQVTELGSDSWERLHVTVYNCLNRFKSVEIFHVSRYPRLDH
jgi:hypothetical protein